MSQELAALHAALGLAAQPNLIPQARKTAFPDGVPLLLEVAAGDRAAIERCRKLTDASEDRIRAASEFYLEQVLLSDQSDSYRTLGADPSASPADLRRNMALLMRWLHPDTFAHRDGRAQIDRTVFAEKVSAAWEDLKSDERRAAYDARRQDVGESDALARARGASRALFKRRKPRATSNGRKKLRARSSPSKGPKRHKGSRNKTTVARRGESWIAKLLRLIGRQR